MAGDDPILRIQLEEVTKPGLPPANVPAPNTQPAPPPISALQANTFKGLPAPETFFSSFQKEVDESVWGPKRALPPPFVPSSPEKPAPTWKPGEDPVIDAITDITGKFSDLDEALGKLQDTVEHTEQTWDSLPLPFTSDVTEDEADFNVHGLRLSRPMRRGDDYKLPPIMPPGWSPPRPPSPPPSNTPPPLPTGQAIQAPPINPWHSRRTFGLAAAEKLGQAATGLGAQLPGIIGGSVGAGVGAATGSPTLGALAGTGAGSLAAALPAAVAIPLGAVGIAAAGVVEGFRALRSMTNQLASSVVGISGAATAASARAEVRELENKLYTAREAGGILAQNITAESQLDAALNRYRTELVKEWGPLINTVIEALTTLVDIAATFKKDKGWAGEIVEYILKGPFGFAPLIAIAKWWQGDQKAKDADDLDAILLNFLNPNKVNEIPHPRKEKRANVRRPGGIF